MCVCVCVCMCGVCVCVCVRERRERSESESESESESDRRLGTKRRVEHWSAHHAEERHLQLRLRLVEEELVHLHAVLPLLVGELVHVVGALPGARERRRENLRERCAGEEDGVEVVALLAPAGGSWTGGSAAIGSEEVQNQLRRDVVPCCDLPCATGCFRPPPTAAAQRWLRFPLPAARPRTPPVRSPTDQ